MNLSFFPTGCLYDKNNLQYAYQRSLSYNQSNNLINQTNVTPLSHYRPLSGWVKTHEPEDHLDYISSLIIEYSIPKNILCFSYKDVSLAKRITDASASQARINVLVDSQIGIIKSHPEDIIDTIDLYLDYNLPSHYDLIICRHFLEHFVDPSKLLALFQNHTVSAQSLIYVEVPDCYQFLIRKKCSAKSRAFSKHEADRKLPCCRRATTTLSRPRNPNT